MTTAAVARPNLIRHPDFVKLWVAESISVFGSQISQLAIPLLAIVLLDASAFEVGTLTAVGFLPFLLVGLPAGVWVDRLRRRPIMIAADAGRAVLLLSIPGAWLLGLLSLPQLYAVTFLAGILTVLFDVGYQAYLPSLVHRDQLMEGNGKLEMSLGAGGWAGSGRRADPARRRTAGHRRRRLQLPGLRSLPGGHPPPRAAARRRSAQDLDAR